MDGLRIASWIFTIMLFANIGLSFWIPGFTITLILTLIFAQLLLSNK